MNKKNVLIAGVLAGSLFLSTSSPEVTLATSNTDNTSTTHKLEYPIKYSYKLNGLFDSNFNFLKKLFLNKEPLITAIEQAIKKDETKAPEKEEVQVPEKEEVTVPEKEEVQVPEKEEVTVPEKEEVEVPEKEEVTVPEKEEVQVPEKEEAVVTPPVTEEEAKPEQKPVEDNEEVQVSAEIQQVVNLTNQERAKAGLKALQIDTKLTQSAQAKSQEMKDKNYFSHTSPTYGSPFDLMKAFGVTYKSAAENIAQGQRNASEVVKAWMESSGHRANIMNPSFTHIGVGLSDSGYYWTQQFISK